MSTSQQLERNVVLKQAGVSGEESNFPKMTAWEASVNVTNIDHLVTVWSLVFSNEVALP